MGFYSIHLYPHLLQPFVHNQTELLTAVAIRKFPPAGVPSLASARQVPRLLISALHCVMPATAGPSIWAQRKAELHYSDRLVEAWALAKVLKESSFKSATHCLLVVLAKPETSPHLD